VLRDLHRDGVAVSVIALAEVAEGAHHSPDPTTRLANIRRLLAGYTVLDVTETISDRFARERATLRRQGADFSHP
jgi:predicted nucleic acid-binding protein